MIKVLIFTALLPILSGSTAGIGDVRDFYPKEIVYRENTPSSFSKELRVFVNAAMKEKGCNPSALYRIQKETTYPISDLHGQTTFIYSLEMRVFGENDQSYFNGYENSQKFRKRTITIRQNQVGLSLVALSCENKKAR